MTIKWKLKSYLSNTHSIYKIIEFKKKIEKETGIIISPQNLSKYVNKRPQLLNLDTIQIICSALQCSLGDLLEILPSNKSKKKKRKLSYKNTPHCKQNINSFPDPNNYD